jgi:energy-converting hydrogenase Eha subunit E
MNWQDYHATVRSTIEGLDKIIVTLFVQSLAFVGAIVAAVNPGDGLDTLQILAIEAAAFAVSLAFLGITYIYANLLQRAVHVAKRVEEEMMGSVAEDLKLTSYLDEFELAGGNDGKYYYIGVAMLIPVFLALLLLLEGYQAVN